jgi:1-phosphatidylinositol phosphodiesterase
MDTTQWLKGLPGEWLIGNINLPGTHNSAAIDLTRRTLHACQRHSITQQLLGGTRLLDVRLKVRRVGGTFEFFTCHGRIGRNTFQSFSSLLDECRVFLAEHPSEFVILLLKVDDWSNAGAYVEEALAALAVLLGHYPTLSGPALPTLDASRGKLFLYNQLNDDPVLGVPIRWAQDTTGSAAVDSRDRSYEVWVQDRYNDVSLYRGRAKLRWVMAALEKKTPENVVLNFASGTWFGVFRVYVMEPLSRFLRARGTGRFGWILFDYPFEGDVVATIIDSNLLLADGRLIVAS